MNNDVLISIRAWLDEQNVEYRQVHHPPTKTSRESAKARGEDIRIGGKALVLKTGDDFRLFVMSAARRLDSNAVRKHFKVKRMRFADASELLELTGLVPGSVPPFGEPILSLPLYVDESIYANDRIAFNAGSLTDSIIMSVADYKRIANGSRFSFSE